MPIAKTPDSVTPDSVERILLAATHLFAEQGFEGVTTRQISAAAGLNMATVHHHVGTKRQLYDRVLAGLFQEERDLVEPYLAKIDENVLNNPQELSQLLSNLLSDLVDFMDKSPARARLYMRRWLEDAQEDGDSQNDNLAFYSTLRGVLSRAQTAGTIHPAADLDLLLRGFDWLLNGYYVTGPLGRESLRGNPHDAQNILAFKKYLNAYVMKMLGL